MVSTVILMLSLSSCDGLLDVEVPGRLPADALDDPGLIEILVASVQADFECAYASFAAFTGLFHGRMDVGVLVGPECGGHG